LCKSPSVAAALKADYDLSGFAPEASGDPAGLEEVRMILADNGNDNFISGAPDPRWEVDALRQLTACEAFGFAGHSVDGGICWAPM
jgi:hypothetical protein